MKAVAGIDEAGRGPLAGPVAVACVVIRSAAVRKAFPRVRDSKKLTPRQRDTWFADIVRLEKQKALSYAVKLVGAKVIDARGITHAITLGIVATLEGARARKHDSILLDGGLRAPQGFSRQKTIIKGDERELPIALASVVAKVTRDRYMERVGKRHAHYGFKKHKGYGTKEHMKALRKYGLSSLHRRTFCTKLTKSK